jgi:hypothetical protein
MAGAAWGQSFSVSGNVSTAETNARPATDNWQGRAFPYDRIRFTVKNNAQFGITQTLGMLASGLATQVGLFIPVAGDVDPNSVNFAFSQAVFMPNLIVASPGSTKLMPGQYEAIIAINSAASYDYALTFFGATLGWGPSTEEELSALLSAAGGSARLVVLDAQGVARDLGQASIVARGDQLTLELVEATDGDDVVVSSKSETPGLVGNLYTWAQITGFDSEADDGPASINGTGFQIGADMAVGTDMVAGLSLGYSDINASDDGFSQDGTLTYLQPYFSYRSGAWQGNASLIFGQGDYDQTSDGGDGSGETELFAFTFEGGYDMALQNGLTVTPMVGLISGSEDVTGISGTLADAGTESYDFTQASLGARLTSRKPAGTYFAGLHADYLDQDAGTVLTSEFLSENGWSGRVEVGGATQLDGGFGLSTSFDISGIGGSAQTLSGGLRVALQF